MGSWYAVKNGVGYIFAAVGAVVEADFVLPLQIKLSRGKGCERILSSGLTLSYSCVADV
jgi:hypothetical protein